MDYMYPSVFLAYFLFAVLTLLTLYWLIRTWRAGFWGSSEEPKYRMMQDDDEGGSDGR
jgi:protein-S-isoprenylcysteine O-methyltransferase Ste14